MRNILVPCMRNDELNQISHQVYLYIYLLYIISIFKTITYDLIVHRLFYCYHRCEGNIHIPGQNCSRYHFHRCLPVQNSILPLELDIHK